MRYQPVSDYGGSGVLAWVARVGHDCRIGGEQLARKCASCGLGRTMTASIRRATRRRHRCPAGYPTRAGNPRRRGQLRSRCRERCTGRIRSPLHAAVASARRPTRGGWRRCGWHRHIRKCCGRLLPADRPSRASRRHCRGRLPVASVPMSDQSAARSRRLRSPDVTRMPSCSTTSPRSSRLRVQRTPSRSTRRSGGTVTWSGKSSALRGSHQPRSCATVMPLNTASGARTCARAWHCDTSSGTRNRPKPFTRRAVSATAVSASGGVSAGTDFERVLGRR
jgi:hypothetical protein